MSWQTTIIPALQGTYILDASKSGYKLDVFKTPVIAWAVVHNADDDSISTTAHPVRLGYAVNHSFKGFPGKYTILHPCGSVEEFPSEVSWDTYEEYVAYHEADIKDKNDKN